MMRNDSSLAPASVLAAFLMAICGEPLLANTVFVDDSATGTNAGISWTDAYTDLHVALAAATAGDTIWVAAGVYKPTAGTDRAVSFEMVQGVRIYGGFVGTEDPATFDLDSRNLRANETTLSGDLGIAGDNRDNSYCVVVGADNATIDGFTITKACTLGGLPPAILPSNEGGVDCESSSPVIRNCRIHANETAFGGGITCKNGSPLIADCTIANNSAHTDGGGIACLGNSSPTITNCTITNNAAWWAGGGISCSGHASPTITNTIVAFNSSGISVADDAVAVFRYNCTYGNGEYDYAGVPDPTGIDGNISADPQFASPAYGNWHVQPSSPCVNAGDNAAVISNTDMDGEPRIQPAGGAVDIGADESDGTLWPVEPNVVIRVSLDGDDANDGSSWALAKRTVQAGINAACAAGGEVWVRAGTYYECVTLYPYAHVFGGFSGSEAARNQRAATTCATVLDGRQRDPVVTIRMGHRLSTLDALSIVNGKRGVSCQFGSPLITNCTIATNASYGVYCYVASPQIMNCTITDNGTRSGGGVYGLYSSPTITNTIVAFNASGISNDGPPSLRHNCVFGNNSQDYIGVADPTGTDGNISADPLFASLPYGNRHIQPDSPCVDAGDNAAVASNVDMDGQPRTQPAGGDVDIGADESDGTLWPAGPYAVVRVSTNGDDANDGSSWAMAKRTVQAGINAASAAGGDVWVQGGTYYECIMLHPYAHVFGGFAGTETHRDQRDWGNCATTLDAQQQGSVVTIRAGNHASTIDGFSIVNGASEKGGGVDCASCSPRIANCTITNNHASAFGSGIYCHSASPAIITCTITDNTGTGPYSDGGGLCCIYNSSPVITDSTISDNNASLNGGGVCCNDASSPTITNCTISGNSALSGSGIYCSGTASPTITICTIRDNAASANGGGVYCRDSSATITHCTITRNSAASEGGGIHCVGVSSPTIRSCTIAHNSAIYSGGGGIGSDSSSPRIMDCVIKGNSGGGAGFHYGSPTISNCTIAGNIGSGVHCFNSSATIAHCTIAGNTNNGVHCPVASTTIANTIIAFNTRGIYGSSDGTVDLSFNCVHGHAETNYYNTTDPTGTNGNISDDPLFVRLPDAGPDGIWGTDDDDYGDLHMKGGSAVIDAGDNAAVPAEITTDLDGHPRIADGNGDGSAVVDMGAYEYPAIPSDIDFDDDVDIDDFKLFLACFNGPNRAPAASNCSGPDLDDDGDVDLSDFGRFAACFNGPDRSPVCE